MNLHEMLLQDFHNATGFEMYVIVFGCTIVGMALCLVLIVIFKADLLEHYMQGQIDAINGKIKYKLSKNDDNEVIWTEIEK